MISYFRFAELISVGDEVLVSSNDLTPAEVTDVSGFTMQGDEHFYKKRMLLHFLGFSEELNLCWMLLCCQFNVRSCLIISIFHSVLQWNKKNIEEINIQCFALGAFMPVTMEGNMIVDGVLASCYASADHDVAHIAMTPLRWFPEIMDCLFGEDNGMHVYAQVFVNMGQWVLSGRSNSFEN